MTAVAPDLRVAFLGPPGTFSEEALLSQPDLAAARLQPMRSFPEILAAVSSGLVDVGFVALENSIEGTVRLVIDGLVFEHDLLIQREVELPVRQNLIGPSGTHLDQIRRVVSIPVALGQCQRFFASRLPGVEFVASNSTSEAVEAVAADRRPGTVALGSALAAKLYDLEVVATGIDDHPENATRFVVVARSGVPAPTGHDKTSIVCFQDDDHPGSLHGILGQFTARNINLTRLESRPTKASLGNYCFIIDLEGHVDDEVVADCLRDLRAQLTNVKFLGSYPAAGDDGPSIRRHAEAAWRAADEWVASLRAQVRR
ncbi:MAG TPA: prephenate dehydratase [Acidimicrobiales bacterium]|jgi:prephenate dehydratase|nr:prephenate dehydratase [Acidimicrobiales bacterium]